MISVQGKYISPEYSLNGLLNFKVKNNIKILPNIHIHRFKSLFAFNTKTFLLWLLKSLILYGLLFTHNHNEDQSLPELMTVTCTRKQDPLV